MDLAAGQIIHGRYELLHVLGEGGMGVVWSARHRVTDKHVAIKFLRTVSPEQKRRFLREARVAAGLSHPNLVTVHDVLELEDGRPGLVMDLLDGESLADVLERVGRLDLSTFAELFLPVLSAVSAAHAAGVVHRDLKPDNVFLTSREGDEIDVRVLDFGIAKVALKDGPIRHTAGLTQTGSVLGTPLYMAPEQVFGEPTIDHRADVWALGVVAYECLAGACPIRGENVGQIFKSISQHDFPRLAAAAPSLPHAVGRVVDEMLSTRADDRPSLRAAAEVFATASGLPLPAVAAPLSRDATADAPSLAATGQGLATTVAAPGASRTKVARPIAVVLAIAVAGLAAWSWGAPSTPPGTPATIVRSLATPVPTASASASPRAAASELAAPQPAAPTSTAQPTQISLRAPAPSPPSASASPRSTATLPGGVHAPSPY